MYLPHKILTMHDTQVTYIYYTVCLHWLCMQSYVACLLTRAYPKMHQHVRLKTLSIMVVVLSGVMSVRMIVSKNNNPLLKESKRKHVVFLFIH